MRVANPGRQLDSLLFSSPPRDTPDPRRACAPGGGAGGPRWAQGPGGRGVQVCPWNRSNRPPNRTETTATRASRPVVRGHPGHSYFLGLCVPHPPNPAWGARWGTSQPEKVGMTPWLHRDFPPGFVFLVNPETFVKKMPPPPPYSQRTSEPDPDDFEGDWECVEACCVHCCPCYTHGYLCNAQGYPQSCGAAGFTGGQSPHQSRNHAYRCRR